MFMLEVLSNVYLSPNAPSCHTWKVIHPMGQVSAHETASRMVCLGLGNNPEIPAELGVSQKTAQFLDSWNVVARFADAMQRSEPLDSVNGIFFNLPLLGTPQPLPAAVSQEIGLQNSLIAQTIAMEDVLFVDRPALVDGVYKMKEVLRRGYGFAGQLGDSLIVYTELEDSKALGRHLQRCYRP